MEPETRKPWWLRVLIALDQLGNVLVLNGHEDETISSNAAKASLRGERWGCVLCKVLDWIDPGHCQDAIERDEGRPTP